MSEVTRVNPTPEGPGPDEWWLSEPEPKAASNYDPEMGELAYSVIKDNMDALDVSLNEADTLLADAAQFLAEALDVEGLVALAAKVADLKRGLAVAEAFLAREAGKVASEMNRREGTLPDGRQFAVKRGAIRKAWDHLTWKRDVLNAIVSKVPASAVVVDSNTGEELDAAKVIGGFIALAQEVHGSTAPKVKALKSLTLDPDDYCTSTPGPYAVIITNP